MIEPETIATCGVRLALTDASTVAVDADGAPALVVAARQLGWAVTCAYPIELLLAGRPDAHEPADPSWGVYDGLAKLARIPQPAGHPDVVAGSLSGDTGTLTVLTNHGPSPLVLVVGLPDATPRTVELEPFGHALLPGGPAVR